MIACLARHRALCALSLGLALAQLTPGIARAQPDDDLDDDVATASDEEATVDSARMHFQRGVDLYADGDVGGALVEFERAYSLQPSYRLLYNMAQVSAELLDYVGAERYFVRYLEEGGSDIDPDRRIEVEAELERLRSRIGTVTVETNEPGAEVFIDDVSVGEAPLQAVPISAGQRRVRVQKSGFDPVTRVVNIIGGQPQSVRIELDPPPPMANIYEYGPMDDEGGTNYPALWAGIATGALLAATVGMGTWAYVGAQAYDDALEEPTTRPELDKLADRAEQRALITDILLGATVASAIVTTVLLVTGTGSSERDEPETIQVGLNGVRLAF